MITVSHRFPRTRALFLLLVVSFILLAVFSIWIGPSQSQADSQIHELSSRQSVAVDEFYSSQSMGSSLITVTGRVIFDTGGPVEGAQVVGSAASDAHAIYLPIVMRQAGASGSAVAGDSTAADPVLQGNETTTDANGDFVLTVGSRLPADVLVEIRFESASVCAARCFLKNFVTLSLYFSPSIAEML